VPSLWWPAPGGVIVDASASKLEEFPYLVGGELFILSSEPPGQGWAIGWRQHHLEAEEHYHARRATSELADAKQTDTAE
jgi:hypothetical protein